MSFLNESKEIVFKFNAFCRQAFDGLRQQCHKHFFHLLGYRAVFATGGKHDDFDVEILQLEQIKNAYSKLFRTLVTDHRDCS